MALSFHDADAQSTGNTLIPKNTVCPVHLTVRPGGHGDGGWLKRNKAGNALMLDCEFTVIEGEYAKRKFWGLFTVEGETDGQKEAVRISRSTIRAMLESARGVKPSDASPEAQKKRAIDAWQDLDGLRFLAVVGIETDKGGQYPDKNRLAAVVTPDRKEWRPLGETSPAHSVAKPAPAAPGRPSWAA